MSNEAPNRGAVVGAWEAVLDHAALKVATYLASSNTPFDASAPLAKSMLCLLDHHTLRGILVERNVSGLCGCFGCPRLPRGVSLFRQRRAEARGRSSAQTHDQIDDDEQVTEVRTEEEDTAVSKSTVARVLTDAEMAYMERVGRHRARDGRPTIISSRPDACSCSDLDEDADGEEVIGNDEGEDGEEGAVGSGDGALSAHADPEELVYDDDYFTLESFRLARRQEQQLTRLRQRAQRAREQRLRGPSQTHGSAAAGRRHLHASLWERFCTVECEDRYRHDIFSAVHHVRTYDHAAMRQAITHLFPRLRPDVVHKLADADVASSADKGALTLVAATVREANDMDAVNDPQRLAPVQTGVDFEATHPTTTTTATDAPVADVLRNMHILGSVWDAEVSAATGGGGVRTHADASAVAAASVHAPQATAAVHGDHGELRTEDSVEEEDDEPTLPLDARRSAGLSGALLVLDFLSAAAGETTHYLFFYYYCLHRHCVLRQLSSTQTNTSLLQAVVRPALAALERKAQALFASGDAASGVTASSLESDTAQAHAARAAGAWRHLLEVRAAEVLRVNPHQQQARRELFAGRYLSGETAAAVARLLLVDQSLLFDAVWRGVWLHAVSVDVITANTELTLADAHAALTLTHSLRFRFAIPSAILQPIGAARESLVLALGLVLSALCVSDNVRLWKAFEQSDEVGALGEIMDAIGVSTEDMAAIVTALVIGQEAA